MQHVVSVESPSLLLHSIKRFHQTKNPNFSDLFKRIVKRLMRAGYTLDTMRQTACLHVVFNSIMVEGYVALFSCTAVVQASDSMTASI